MQIDIDVSDRLSVLGADAGRSLGYVDTRNLAERDHGAAHRRHQHLARNSLRIVAQIRGDSAR